MTYVIAECSGEELETPEVEFANISEGPQGEDVLSYVCPLCERLHTGTVFGKR